MKKSICFVLACMLCTMLSVVNAQESEATIVFDKLVHDFGSIVKSDGPQTHSFEFTNTGNKPVAIQSVSASCGCTSPGWTKEPVAPGEKGTISVTYNPSGMTRFNKSLTVRVTGGTPEEVVLRVQGNVTAETAEK